MPKYSPRTTAGELQKIVVSGSENLFKKLSNITTCCSGGFQEKYPISSKNKLLHIQLSDTTGTSNGTGFNGQIKLNKKYF